MTTKYLTEFNHQLKLKIGSYIVVRVNVMSKGIGERLRGFKKRVREALAIIYLLLTIASALAAYYCYYEAFAPPIENPPMKPIVIGAGNIEKAIIDKTRVVFDIPYQTATIEVTLNISQSDTYFIYALLPFTASNVSSYAIQYGITYPLSPNHPDYMKEIGTFDSHLMNTPEGLAVLNASIQLDGPVYFETQITVGANVRINESLLAIDDRFGGRKTVIYTFFGGNINWTEEMSAFRTPMCQQVVFSQTPFIVQIGLPTSYYFSSSQPAPIEYFVDNDSRWIMFSMDFLNGQYAQTLVCNFENPSDQSNREFKIFLVGVLVTLSITCAFEVVKEAVSPRAKNNDNSENTNETLQPSIASRSNPAQAENNQETEPKTLKEKKKEKTVSLREFAEENHRLITVIGVMGGLAALFTKLENPEVNPTPYSITTLLSFLAFAMMILLSWELWRQFPKSEQASWTVTLFESSAFMFILSLGGYLLLAYPSVIRFLVLPQVVGIMFSVLFTFVFVFAYRKLKAYTYIRKIAPEGKKYSSLKRGAIAAVIISPLYILSLFLSQYLFSLLSPLFG